MDLSRSFHTRMLARTMFSPPSAPKCNSDPQPYTRTKGSESLVSGRDMASLLPFSFPPSSFGNVKRRQELMKSLTEFPGELSVSAIAAAEKRRHQEILNLTKEIERLSSENIQLKEETFEADSNYMDMIDRLATKESQIEDLKTELSQLSEQISMSTAKEEEYISTAKSCMNLEDQIEKLQRELSIQKKDFERLSSTHAACPSPEEIDFTLKEVRSNYKTHMVAVSDQLSERDKLIAELEKKIAKKDEDLRVVAGELTRQKSESDVSEMQRQALEMRVTEMDSVIQDRERLIANMRILMARKSAKVNLLLLKINELEVKLEVCHKRLREHYQVHSIRDSATMSDNVKDFENLRNTCSLRDVQISIKNEASFHGAGDCNVDEDDSQESAVEENIVSNDNYERDLGLLDETSKLQSDIANSSIITSDHDAARLLFKINNIKSKIGHKLDKEIGKRSKIFERIGVSRGQFDRAQLEIEKIRKHQLNAEESRQQIRSRVEKEKRLSEIMECSENEIRVVSAKIASFEKAMRNLKNLENFLIQT